MTYDSIRKIVEEQFDVASTRVLGEGASTIELPLSVAVHAALDILAKALTYVHEERNVAPSERGALRHPGAGSNPDSTV